MHNVETAFYEKEPAWHGLGTVVPDAQSSEEAIRLAGLDWDVLAKPIFLDNGDQIPERYAIVRSTDNKVLGIQSDHYKIMNNKEAFAFTDALLENDVCQVKYAAAGALDEGRRIWLLAHLPERLILSDPIVPYLVFATSHDGSSALTAAMTPTRVVCQNTLTMALNQAKRSWSIRHMGDIMGKRADAARTLNLAVKYMDTMEITAEEYQQKKISRQMLNDIIEMVFPLDDEDSNRVQNNVMALRNQFLDVYAEARDLKKFKGDAWGVYNAFGDFATHIKPLRQTQTFKESLFKSFIDGNKILEKAQIAIEKIAA